jgi:hypothetical protein
MTMDQRDEAFFADDGEPTLPEPSATEALAPAFLPVLPEPEVG